MTSQALPSQLPMEDHTRDATPFQVLANLLGLALPLSLNPILTALSQDVSHQRTYCPYNIFFLLVVLNDN